MALLNIRILGHGIDDALLAKLIIGGVCIAIIVLFTGLTGFSDWMASSLVIWTGATLFIIPFLQFFTDEETSVKHLSMMAIGVVVLVTYSLIAGLTAEFVAISVVQSVIWMTAFSIITDAFKKKVQ